MSECIFDIKILIFCVPKERCIFYIRNRQLIEKVLYKRNNKRTITHMHQDSVK